MDMEILDKKENPLFERTEVRFTLSHPNEPTPKREAIRDLISKELKVSKECIIVDHMNSEFGKGNTQGYAKVYLKKERAMELERKHQLKRNRLIEGDKKEKKKKEVKVEETEDKGAEEETTDTEDAEKED